MGKRAYKIKNKIIKAKEKADRNYPIYKQFKTYTRKFLQVILFPIWIFPFLYEKYDDYVYKNMTFSEEACKKYLDKVIPQMVVHYCENAREFIISSTGDMGDIEFSDFYQHCKSNKKYKNFFLKFNSRLKDYILNEYQIDGYKKMCLTNWTDWEKARKKFDWGSTPYNSDYAKGVVFYIESEEN